MTFSLSGSKSKGRHAAPKASKRARGRHDVVRISKTLPALVLAVLLAGSGTAVASGQNGTALTDGAIGTSQAASRSDSRDDLLDESTSVDVEGTFVTSMDEESVIIDAPLTQQVQDARDATAATIADAQGVLDSGQGKATDEELAALSDVIAQAQAVCADDNASVDSIYAANSSVVESANTVNSAIAAADEAEAQRKARQAALQRATQEQQQAEAQHATTADPDTSYVAVTDGTGTGQEVVNLAIQYLGTPYVRGGNTPAGWDCSGYVQWVYAQFGVSLPHYSGDQAQVGTYIGGKDDLYDKAQPGDIVANDRHAAIYVGGGNCAQAMNPSMGTRIYPCNAVSTFQSGYSIRRIF